MNVDADIADTLFNWLADHQTISPPLRIAAPLVKFTPTDKEMYLLPSFMPNATQSSYVSKGTTYHYGIFQISLILSNSFQGIVKPLQTAGEFVKQFKKDLILFSAEGRKIKITKEPWISAVLVDSVRPVLPISVPYEVAEPTTP